MTTAHLGPRQRARPGILRLGACCVGATEAASRRDYRRRCASASLSNFMPLASTQTCSASATATARKLRPSTDPAVAAMTPARITTPPTQAPTTSTGGRHRAPPMRGRPRPNGKPRRTTGLRGRHADIPMRCGRIRGLARTIRAVFGPNRPLENGHRKPSRPALAMVPRACSQREAADAWHTPCGWTSFAPLRLRSW